MSGRGTSTDAGITPQRVPETWPGIVVATGPESAPNPGERTDNTYWVRRARPATAGSDDPWALEVIDKPDQNFAHVLATNDAENLENSHNVGVGQYVHVRAAPDTNVTSRRYVFTLLTPLAYLFLLGGDFNAYATEASPGVAALENRQFTAYNSDPVDTSLTVNDTAWFENELYICGSFTLAGAVGSRVAKWDGTKWVDVPGHTFLTARSMLVHGGRLIVAGDTSGIHTVWGWDGSAWAALVGLTRTVNVLHIWNGRLYAGMSTGAPSPQRGVNAWDGNVWTSLIGTSAGPGFEVNALENHDDGSGDKLYAAGQFGDIASTAMNNVSRYNGAAWEPVGGGLGPGNAIVHALREYDHGEGAILYAGGIGFTVYDSLVAWLDGAWIPRGGRLINVLAADTPTITALEAHNGLLAVCGHFQRRDEPSEQSDINRIAADGTTAYAALADGFNGTVRAVHEFGGDTIAGGSFTATGGATLPYIASWDSGAAEWSMLGSEAFGDAVRALATFQGDLYAAGDFLTIGSLSAERIAVWNGSAWAAVGVINERVHVLLTNAADTVLYIGGEFDRAGGQAGHILITSWNGSVWSALAADAEDLETGFPHVMALAQDGDFLYVGGRFTSIDGTPANNIARYQISTDTWTAMGGGVDGEVRAISLHGANDLRVGGTFVEIDGGTTSQYTAIWNEGAGTWAAGPAGRFAGPVNAIHTSGGASYFAGYHVGIPARHDVQKLVGAAAWTVVAGAEGILNDQVLAVTTADGVIHIGGRFIKAGAFGTLIRRHEMLAALWNGDDYEHAAGGCGTNAHGGAIQLDSGQAASARSLTIDGNEFASLFVGGDFGSCSQGYSGGVTAATNRGFRGLQEGASFASDTDQRSGALAIKPEGGKNLIVGGNFLSVYNLEIAAGDVGTISKIISANNIARWNGRYWAAMGAGLGGGVIRTIEKYDDGGAAGERVYAAGDLAPQVYNEADDPTPPAIETWNEVDARFESGPGEFYRRMKAFGGDLYVAGDFNLTAGAAVVAKYSGTPPTAALVANDPAGMTDAHDFAVADFGSGDELYVVGNVPGTEDPVFRLTGGGAWVVVQGATAATSLTQSGVIIFSATFIEFADKPRLIICGEAFMVGSVICSVASWDGTSWEAIGETSGHLNQALAVSGPFSTINPKKLYLAGDFGLVTDPVSSLDASVFNFAEWTPADGWATSPHGGLNLNSRAFHK